MIVADPFRVIVADPPWSFDDDMPKKGTKFGRGARAHYRCMSIADIARFPLPPIDEPAFLLLWRVAAMQSEALAVCNAWGFTPKSEIVWLKKTRRGNRHFGMGRYVRQEHETCIIATRGKRAHQLVQRRNIRSTFEAPAGRHSEKPEAFFDLVERLLPGPYVELFARRRRAGWTCLGNELPEERAA